MSYKTALITLLDRPGGRFLLGKIATAVAQRNGATGVQILYHQKFWTRRVGQDFFPDTTAFEYRFADFNAWAHQMEHYFADAQDYWFRHYAPSPGDTIVDVGAGRGEDTVAFSRAVGPSGRVIAIEAHPATFAALKKFCQLNRLTNVTPIHAALMDSPGSAKIVESSSSWLENEAVHGQASSGAEVRAVTFTGIFQEYGLPDIAFLKMNIEGAERFALPGMTPVIRRIRSLCVACHDFRADMGHGEQFRTRAFVERFLTEHGFTAIPRSEDPRPGIRDHVFGSRVGDA